MYMTEFLATLQDLLCDWLVHGLGNFSGWQLWMPSGASSEQLVADLQAWLKTAEAGDNATLHEFAPMLRAVRACDAVNA